MGVIFNEAEAVWEWLMTHLIVINLLFSIIIIFFQRRDPRSVWTWLFALNFIPVFGIIFYLLFGQDLKKSRMFKVKGISDRLNMPVKSQEEIIRSSDIPEEMMDPLIRDFRSLILYNLETSGAVLTTDNQVKIYTDGQAKFEGLGPLCAVPAGLSTFSIILLKMTRYLIRSCRFWRIRCVKA